MVVPPININIRKHTKSVVVMQAAFDFIQTADFVFWPGVLSSFGILAMAGSGISGVSFVQLSNCCDLTTISVDFKVGISFIQL